MPPAGSNPQTQQASGRRHQTPRGHRDQQVLLLHGSVQVRTDSRDTMIEREKEREKDTPVAVSIATVIIFTLTVLQCDPA
jgi:hypothetical protein